MSKRVKVCLSIVVVTFFASWAVGIAFGFVWQIVYFAVWITQVVALGIWCRDSP